MPLPRRAPIGLSRTLIRRPQRRFVGHDSHGHEHGQPVKESLGPIFYGAVGIFPAFYLLWSFSQNSAEGEEPYLRRWFRRFESWQDEYRERNVLHAHLAQQAANDRILFANTGTASSLRKVKLLNAESLSTWSHQNIQPGWGSINLTPVLDKIKEEDAETEERNVARYEKRKADGYYERD